MINKTKLESKKMGAGSLKSDLMSSVRVHDRWILESDANYAGWKIEIELANLK